MDTAKSWVIVDGDECRPRSYAGDHPVRVNGKLITLAEVCRTGDNSGDMEIHTENGWRSAYLTQAPIKAEFTVSVVVPFGTPLDEVRKHLSACLRNHTSLGGYAPITIMEPPVVRSAPETT
jgi:hypothetical protein